MQNLARALFGFSLFLLAACEATPPEVRSSLTSTPQLTMRAPVDIAVLPIQDATGTRSLDPLADRMRTEVARSLVNRAYSPLAFQIVDKALPVEASSSGLMAVDPSYLKTLSGKWYEDAVLGLRVTRWDTSSLQSTGWVRFAADVLMVDSRSGETLWSGPVEGRVKSGGSGPAPMDTLERNRDAAAQFVKEVFMLLPNRPLLPASAQR